MRGVLRLGFYMTLALIKQILDACIVRPIFCTDSDNGIPGHTLADLAAGLTGHRPKQGERHHRERVRPGPQGHGCELRVLREEQGHQQAGIELAYFEKLVDMVSAGLEVTRFVCQFYGFHNLGHLVYESHIGGELFV